LLLKYIFFVKGYLKEEKMKTDTQPKESFLTKLKKNHSLSFDLVFFSLSLLVILITLVSGYSYFHNSSAILNLSEDLIDQVNKRIINNTTNYLFKAVDMAELSSEITTDSIKNLKNNPGLEPLMLAILKTQPRLNTFYLGNENGDFLMLRREVDKTFSTKSIFRTNNIPKTTWKYRNIEGKVIKTEDVQDPFDPRVRPWYIGAKGTKATFWSDVYVFHTGKVPGVTTAQPVLLKDQLIGVIALDIPLLEISNFMQQIEKELKEQKLGADIQAFIVNEQDQIIAFPDYSKSVLKEGDVVRPRKVNELGDKVIEGSYHVYKDHKKTIFSFSEGGKRYIASYKHFPADFQNKWTIGLVVPEQDLIGAIVRTNNLSITVTSIILISAVFLGLILNQLKQALKKRNEFIRSTFGRYLSDDIVDSILESPEGTKLGGEKRMVTIMMTDLRGFTSLSEGLPAETCVNMINIYLDTMTEIILKHKGTIDEFIGDAILVIFGAPLQKDDDAKRAVACAIEMQLAMEVVNAKNKELGYPAVSMGIGINTGEVVVGNIGSSKRTKYGVVGSHVNLTSRVESYTVGGQTYISEETKKQCGDILRIDSQMDVKPKGVKNTITIFEIGGIGGSFNIYLPEKQKLELKALSRSADMDFIVLAGKHAGKDIHKGKLNKIKDKDAEFETTLPLNKLDNLQMTLLNDAGGVLIDEIYAKVVDILVEGKTVHLNFTSIPQASMDAFHRFVEDRI
jgi:class 3 adenylate cyclase